MGTMDCEIGIYVYVTRMRFIWSRFSCFVAHMVYIITGMDGYGYGYGMGICII